MPLNSGTTSRHLVGHSPDANAVRRKLHHRIEAILQAGRVAKTLYGAEMQLPIPRSSAVARQVRSTARQVGNHGRAIDEQDRARR